MTAQSFTVIFAAFVFILLFKPITVTARFDGKLCITAYGIEFFWAGPMGSFLALITILGNIPFIIIQRYNRPMLVSLAERLEEREKRRQHACADSIG